MTYVRKTTRNYKILSEQDKINAIAAYNNGISINTYAEALTKVKGRWVNPQVVGNAIRKQRQQGIYKTKVNRKQVPLEVISPEEFESQERVPFASAALGIVGGYETPFNDLVERVINEKYDSYREAPVRLIYQDFKSIAVQAIKNSPPANESEIRYEKRFQREVLPSEISKIPLHAAAWLKPYFTDLIVEKNQILLSLFQKRLDNVLSDDVAGQVLTPCERDVLNKRIEGNTFTEIKISGMSMGNVNWLYNEARRKLNHSSHRFMRHINEKERIEPEEISKRKKELAASQERLLNAYNSKIKDIFADLDENQKQTLLNSLDSLIQGTIDGSLWNRNTFDKERAKQIRIKANLSQEELAERLGERDSRGVVSYYERGLRIPTLGRSSRFARKYLLWLKGNDYNPYNL